MKWQDAAWLARGSGHACESDGGDSDISQGTAQEGGEGPSIAVLCSVASRVARETQSSYNITYLATTKRSRLRRGTSEEDE